MLKVIKVSNDEIEKMRGSNEVLSADESALRRVKISRDNLKERRFTANCPGCKAVVTGSSNVKVQSEECRK